MTTEAAIARPVFRSVAPQFTVPDVVAASSYYCDVLGFEHLGYFGDPPVFAMVGRGPVEFFFNQNSGSAGQTGNRSAIGYDAYIHVTGIEELSVELRERGAKIIEGLVTRSYLMRELVIEDCHGLRIAFGQDITSD
ncbi:MAG TPA: hypothetical protein PKD64_10370 [Pirellulaceae bacterium]|nr:hypothetical protein [Pirellulaceae bacterium]HMO92586.1 hypothetical protein [Pirellulaceae bacterium]HMP71465.1 hypothetical protein [Pirellulaceae bacterium]